MAGRKSQAQIEFSVNNKQFNDALGDMKGEIKDINKEFALQKEQMKNTADESEKLIAKIENLKDIYIVQEKAIETASDAYEEATRLMGENSKEAEIWKNKLTDAKIALEKTGNAIKESGDEYDKSVKNMTGYGKKLQDLQGESKSLEEDLKDIEKALKMDPGNSDLIAQKQRNIDEQVKNTTDSLEELRKQQNKIGDVDSKGYEKLSREIVIAEGKLGKLNNGVNELGDEIKQVGDDSDKSIGEIGTGFKALLAGGAIAGIAEGAGEIAAKFGEMAKEAMEFSKNTALIKFSMNIDDKSVKAVQDSMRSVEAYGVDSQEALEGVRKQFLLNKDASKETNDEVVKGAGYLATAYSGLDFTEIIQETNEMADIFEISQKEALGMVDALLKVGFPESQLDIIAEYGTQLKMAGYEAEEIQAIFKAGIDTGTPNIDQLLDGIKEGRIKLTEFATAVPESLKPAIKSLGMTQDGFQDLSKAIATGGDGGKKAMVEVAQAVLDIKDKTKQAEAGVAIYGTLWEEQGTKVAETIVNAADQVVSMTGNVDVLNRSIAGMDNEPAIRFEKAMSDLSTTLIPVKTALAEIASNGLDIINAAMQGTSISLSQLDKDIKIFVDSGGANADLLKLNWQEMADGTVMVQREIVDGLHYQEAEWRYATESEIALMKEKRASFETHEKAITTAQEEQLSTRALTMVTKNTEMVASTTTSFTAMDVALRNYATTSGTELVKAKDDVTKLAEKYGFSESKVVTVLENWGGSVAEFDKAHGEALGRAEQAVVDYTSTATNGFSKLAEDETISWSEYMTNMESNRKAQANWWKNLKILNAAGIDDAIIAEWQAMGPEAAPQMQRFVDDLYKNSDKQGVAYDDMDKKTKSKVDKMNETRRKSLESGGRIADEAINEADWPGKGDKMIDDMAQAIADKAPYLRRQTARTGSVIEEEVNQSLEEVKRRAANLEWKIPRPTIPKFTLSGSLNVAKGTVPKLITSWYANGGYADKTSLIGMGEAGAEGIVPLQGKHMMPFADAVAERITNNNNSTVINISAVINNDMDVEALGKKIDKHLNTQAHDIKISKGK